MHFMDVCSFEGVASGTALAVRIGDGDVTLFNVDGTVHAIENSCLHAGASSAAGNVCGNLVAFAAHGGIMT